MRDSGYRNMLVRNVFGQSEKSAADTKQNLKKLQDAERSLRALSEPTPEEGGEDNERDGYDENQRKQLDGLSNSVEE